MSDFLFFKQLHSKADLWLGLRMPSKLRVNFLDGRAEVSTDWVYQQDTPLPAGVQQLWVPTLVRDDHDTTLTWKNFDLASRQAPYPFQDLEDDFSANLPVLRELIGELDDAQLPTQFTNQLATLRQVPRVPLRSLEAYRTLEPADLGARVGPVNEPDTNLMNFVDEAMGGQARSVNIDLFSGLVFVARGKLAKAAGLYVFIDPAPDLNGPGHRVTSFTLGVRQTTDRVLLRPAIDGTVLTNTTIHDQFPEAKFEPYYRLERSLGVEGRAPWRSGLMVIPRMPPQVLPGNVVDVKPPQDRRWDDRDFQVGDPVGDAFRGELLNYRLELFNLHGRRMHSARALVVRQDMRPPAAPTRGSARLALRADEKSPVFEIRMDFAKSEHDELLNLPSALQPVVYTLSTSRIPTGFYGDADDAALAVARLLSDMNPAAVLASGLASAEVDASVRELADARLSAHGLTEISLEHSKLEKRIVALPTASGGGAARRDADDLMEWSLKLAPEDLQKHLEEGRGIRLFLAMRRKLPEHVFPGAQKTLESAVIPLDMSVVDANGDVVNAVQHFEDFWNSDTGAPTAGEDDARVLLAPKGAPGKKPPGVTGSLQVQLDHAEFSDRWRNIGGYRLWSREAAGTNSAWSAVAVIQVVPPLVKAYAPIETGRLWDVEEANLEIPAIPRPATIEGVFAKRLLKTDWQPKPPDNTGAPRQPTVPAGVNDSGTTLLAFMKELASSGFAAEYILSVSQRRRLERCGIAMLAPSGAAAPGTPTNEELPEGNWLLLKDQNGHYLGRAWNYWGNFDAASRLAKRYTVIEVPNAQDTVATDDFGQATWTWHGLTDEWGHDFEWVVEPLSRYAPLLQRLALARREKEEQDKEESKQKKLDAPDRYLYSATQPSLAPPDRHWVHRVRVQRTAPLTARFGLVQRIEREQDLFVFRVLPPDEFRNASFNSIARSAYGAHKMRVLHASRAFADRDHYTGAEAHFDKWADQILVKASAGKSLYFVGAGPSSPYDDPQELPFLADLLIDEPACLTIELSLQPIADGVVATEEDPPNSGKRKPLETRLKGARRPPLGWKKEIPDLQPTLGKDELSLSIPLARLEWSYSGASDPPMSLVTGASPELADRRLLRLPDPAVEVHVYRRNQSGFIPIAVFLGPAAAGKFTAPEGFVKESPIWGVLWRREVAVEGEGVLAEEPGTIFLRLSNTAKLEDLHVVWRRDGFEDLSRPIARSKAP